MNDTQQETTRLRPDGLPDAATDLSGMIDLGGVSPRSKLDDAAKARIRAKVEENTRQAPPEVRAKVLYSVNRFLDEAGNATVGELTVFSLTNALDAIGRKLEHLDRSVLSLAHGLVSAGGDGKQTFELGNVGGLLQAGRALLEGASSQLRHAVSCECFATEDTEPSGEAPATPREG